jgi:hypothetical protein|tara:strand:+ start:655 stop:1083 length:429 start_codon:yes stop_codon:yes gene_type:complete
MASKVRYPYIMLNTFEVRSIPLDRLFCPCATVNAFVERLAESFEKDGLLNPVIVVRLSVEDFLARKGAKGKAKLLKRIPADWQTINVVWGGNNRVEAARILGFDEIDCVMMPNFDVAMQVQDNHREWNKADARKQREKRACK